MHRYWRLCLLFLAMSVVACDDDPTAPDPTPTLSGRPTIYYAGVVDQTIWRLDRDAPDPVALRTEPGSTPSGIAVDTSTGKVYWSDYVANKIQRANLDGTGIEDVVVEDLDTPWTIAFDAEGEMLYWMDTGTGKLQRWPVSGGPVEDVLSGLTGRSRSMAFGPDPLPSPTALPGQNPKPVR